ncbi:hypothetical protein D3C78_1247750 [compost metagenome]
MPRGRHCPAHADTGKTDDCCEQCEIENDRTGIFRLRQMPDLDHRYGGEKSRCQTEQTTEHGNTRPGGDIRNIEGKMRRQDKHDAAQPEDHRRPAINPHDLLQKKDRQNDGKKWRGIADGRRISERNVSQRQIAEDHAAGSGKTPHQMPANVAGRHLFPKSSLHGHPQTER